MALTIRDILTRNLFPGLMLAAGEHGSDNHVTWVNIMEILDTPDTVKAGELLITTGFGLQDRGKFGGLIARLHERGVSGIAVQTGYYIDAIPDYILEDADHYGLPILDLPAEYSFSDILHILIGEIGSDKELMNPAGYDTGAFLSAMRARIAKGAGIAFTPGTESYLVCVCAVDVAADQKEEADAALRQVSSFLQSEAEQMIALSRDVGQGCFLLTFKDGKNFHAVSYDLQIRLTLISENQGIAFYAGIDKAGPAEDLPLTFRHASECIALLNEIEARRGVCPYDNYTFISHFGTLYRNSRGYSLQSQPLQLLLARDRSRSTNYTHTLRVYLAENCNVSRSAQLLFIHRHTLINRLQSIREITGVDFRNYYSRLALSVALMMHDIYGA